MVPDTADHEIPRATLSLQPLRILGRRNAGWRQRIGARLGFGSVLLKRINSGFMSGLLSSENGALPWERRSATGIVDNIKPLIRAALLAKRHRNHMRSALHHPTGSDVDLFRRFEPPASLHWSR